MTTVVYHSADFDGVFCREVAKRALGEDGVRYEGWNFGGAPLEFPAEGEVIGGGARVFGWGWLGWGELCSFPPHPPSSSSSD